MHLRFLGTGAADWSIGRRVNGEFFRRYSSSLVDSTLLIDPGPHIFDFAAMNDMPDMFAGVTDIIVTHSHGDHFNKDSVLCLCRESGRRIRLWADPAVFTKFNGIADGVDGVILPEFCPVTPGTAVSAGGYAVLPCRSNHGSVLPGETTINYIVSKDGHCFFYGLDSGWIIYDTWNAIKAAKPNAVIFECTVGLVDGDDRIFGHTSVAMIGLMMEAFVKNDAGADGCRFYASHMARTLHGSHAETTDALAPFGVVPAYDGMIIDI